MELSGAIIRALSRGVIGISVLQAVLGGIGMSLAGAFSGGDQAKIKMDSSKRKG